MAKRIDRKLISKIEAGIETDREAYERAVVKKLEAESPDGCQYGFCWRENRLGQFERVLVSIPANEPRS